VSEIQTQTTAAPGPSPELLAKLANYLEIKVLPERATLLLKANFVLEKIVPTADALHEILKKQGVIYGCDRELLARIVTEKLYGSSHIVAQSTPPQHGLDARIETLVQVSGEAKPVVGADGRADYRNVDNIHQVAEGAVLQQKHAATAGQPGKDVYGHTIPARPGLDVVLRLGVNTVVSPDGMQLLSTRGGYLFLQGEAIGVGEGFEVAGDVNFKTGNIIYHGDVHVFGGVAEGFRVEADGDVTIDGLVDGAVVVSLTGSVTIKGAIFGHGHAEIKAAKDINVLAVQDATLVAGGNITVEKELRQCHLTCHGFIADAPGCHVLGGSIVSYGETRMAMVGADGLRTEIRVGDKVHEDARVLLADLTHKLEQLRPLATSLEQKLKTIKANSDRLRGKLTASMSEELKVTVTRYTELQKALRGLNEEDLRVRALLASPIEKHWPVRITEQVIDSVHLKVYGLHVDLRSMDAPGQWLWTDQGVLKTGII
jgi:uncharacterized protein